MAIEEIEQTGETATADDPAADRYFYQRLTKVLVKAGYGSYTEAENCELTEAAIFLHLENDKDTRIEKWLGK